MSILRRKLRRDITRQKWQFAAVIVTIIVGVTLYGASFDSFRNLTRSYERTYDQLDFADLTVAGGDLASFTRAAGSTTGVVATTRRVQADLPVVVGENHRLYGRIVGMPTDDQPAVDKVQIETGSYLSSGRPDGVLVEQHMYDHFDLSPGDTIQVFLGSTPTEVEVLGAAVSPEYLWPARSRQELFTTPDDFGVLFVPEDLAEQAPATSRVDQALVRYGDGTDTASLDAALGRAATAAGAADVQTQADQPSNAALSEDVQGFGELSFMFPLLFLTAAGMATFILINRIVHAQRGQIGTLMANGLGRRPIRRHVLGYGLAVGLTGSVIGAIAGVILGDLMTGAYTSALSIPDTVAGFYPLTPLLGVVFGVVMGSLSALAPARAAVKVSPAEAMRGSQPTSSSGPSLVERLVPPLRRLPIRWRMSVRGIGRNARRSASTVAGVVLALTLILVSWGMLDTTQILVDEQFDTIQHNDAQAFFATTVDDSVVATVAGTDGVRAAEPVVAVSATIADGDEQYATQLQGFEQDTAMHTFVTSSGRVSLPDAGVLAGSSVKGLIGADQGDHVTISFPALGTSIDTTIAGFVDEPLGTYLYMAQPELEDLLAGASPPVGTDQLESPSLTSVMAIYDEGADADQVQSRLFDLPDIAAVVSSKAILEVVDAAMSFFYVFVGIMLVFGGTMAFALLFNMISVNISERSVELATMRANGLTAREVNRLITGENLLLTVIGLPIGLAIGYAVSALFMASYTSDLFDFSLHMRWTTLFLAAVAIMVTTLLSQWPGLRAVARLDIATVVRERAQ